MDWGDCLKPYQWYERYLNSSTRHTERFIVLEVAKRTVYEVYIGKPNYRSWTTIETKSYYIDVRYAMGEIFVQQCNLQPLPLSGISNERNSNEHNYELINFMIFPNTETNTTSSTSTPYGSTEPNVLFTDDPYPIRDSYSYSFVGRFKEVSVPEDRVFVLKGACNIYSSLKGTTEYVFKDEVIGTGTGSTPRQTIKYSIDATFCLGTDVSGNFVYAPYLQELLIPSEHAWTFSDDRNLIVSYRHNELPTPLSMNYECHNTGSWYMNQSKEIDMYLIPERIRWIRPYPKGKWYMTEYGLTTRGLPEPLIDDQGAFNKCKNLTSVTIPDSVKSIGEWSFRETQLKEITIASDCTYHAKSFPTHCKIYFSDGTVPKIRNIADMQANEIGRLCTMSINELEGI